MLLIFSLLSSVVGILFGGYLFLKVVKEDLGSEKIKELTFAIQEGASAFLKRELKILLIVFIFLAILLGFLINIAEGIAFLIGGIVSLVAGYTGMKIATKANGRCSNAAISSFSKAFQIAFYSGSVMGMAVVSFGLFGSLMVWFLFHNYELLLAFAFGSSLVALFLRVGGGIYTKSADIGADLVGKVEAGIPEDDARNPAVIADQVGDNVGDIAGMGSDLFESYVSAIVATAVIGFAIFGEGALILPTLLAGAGILASIIGVFFVRVKDEGSVSFKEQTEKVRKAMSKGIIVANVLMIVFAWFIIKYLGSGTNVFWALFTGLLVGVLIGQATDYYTSDQRKPTKNIANSSESGPSINILEGFSQGLLSTAIPAIGVAVAMIVAFKLAGLFGIAIASLGILLVLGINLSSDSYGPIVDNAAGIAEMAGLTPEVRQRADALDSVGNSTAATGKGFAIGSAGLASLAWIATYFHIAKIEVASIMDPEVIAGLLIGATLSFVFTAISIKAVGRGAFAVVTEVRRQFREIPGIMDKSAKPDYSKIVDMTTKQALKEMILPGILVVLTPIAIGIILGLEALGGFLVGALLSGFLLAIMMANAGGAWDNAKKYIEAGNLGGKGSTAHKAAVIGDTVGDPMKDTAGPSLNILIKLIGKVAIVFIPLFLLFS